MNFKILRQGLLGIGLAGVGAAVMADTASDAPWALSLRSAHHSDALPLHAFGDDDSARRALSPRRGRNLAYVDDEFKLGRRVDAWQWAVVARSHATLVSSEDALDLALRLDRDAAPSADRSWQTDLRYQAFQGGGIELGRALAPAPGWQLAWTAQALRLRHWRERRLDGPVHFDAASTAYSFDLRSTQVDDRLDFPFRSGFRDVGTGLLFGGRLGWRGDALAVSLGVRDVGALRWRGLPQQRAALSTQTRSYDADGFLLYQPLIQGRNSQAGLTRRLPGRWDAGVSWRTGRLGELEASAEWLRGFGALPSLAWRREVAGIRCGLHWRWHERRAAVSLGWRGWQLQLGADRLGRGMRSREASLVGRFDF